MPGWKVKHLALGCFVLSSDSMIYGGLVASRTHKLSDKDLGERTTRLLQFKKQFGGIPVYVFTTVMRAPKANSAPVEPAYYKIWRPDFSSGRINR